MKFNRKELMLQKLAQYCEGPEDAVDAAPDMDAKEIENRIRELASRPAKEVTDEEFDELFYALAKGLKSGALRLDYVQ